MSFKVYTASVLSMVSTWKVLKKEWAPQILLNSRWIDHSDIVAADAAATEDQFKTAWKENEEDVFNADALLCYAVEGHNLRGALVETGMAIAFRMPVIVCGRSPFFGSWQYHPRCFRVPSLEQAHDLLLKWCSDDGFPEL
jgi:hypothetical protein